MKKLLSLALAAAMCLSLAACSGGGTKQPSGGSGQQPAGSGLGSVKDQASQSNNGAQGSSSQPIGGADGSTGIQVTDSDLQYVKNKGTLIVGITDFAPMDYKHDSGQWIGFDADMANFFADKLGVTVEFVELADWDMKAMELETKNIDVVWNGMTLDDEVRSLMSVSEPYCRNGQVVVVPVEKAADYQTLESLKDLSFAVENGSAGSKQLDALGLKYTATDNQAKALLEVASNASDACVIDLLMAGAMIGEGTDYSSLTYTVQLNDEEYGVGFRKGSDLVDAFNAFWKEAYDAGTVMSTAEIYGVQESIIEK